MTKQQLLSAMLLMSASVSTVYAQTAITAVHVDTLSLTGGSRNYTATKAYGGNLDMAGSYDIYFGAASGFSDNAAILRSFASDGSVYTYNTGISTSIRLRRVENAAMTTYRSVAGIPQTVAHPTPRDLVYFEGEHINLPTDHSIRVKAPYVPQMEDLFLTNDITQGVDNLFGNTGSNTFNNIERMDVIVASGVSVINPGVQGFALFERGSAQAHEPIVVALITGLDINGDPQSYAAKVVRVETADYMTHPGQTENVYQPVGTASSGYMILRRDEPGADLNVADWAPDTEGMGGVMIKYSDFDITPGTTVYGYSLMGADFPLAGTGSDALVYTHPFNFPTTTSSTAPEGGNDLAAITGVVKMMTISGQVFHDTLGLQDNMVNGSLIQSPSGVALYVNLIDSSGIVVGVTAVQSNGSFVLDKMALGVLEAVLSTTAGAIGQPAPAATLPAGWVAVGEHYGMNNLMGTGTEPATLADGRIRLRLGEGDITDLRFGIERMPETSPHTTTVPTPAQNTYFTLDGTGINPPVLSGSDWEDQAAEAGLNGKTIAIISLPTNGELWYNGVQITGGTQNSTSVPSPANPFYINSYDPSLLQFKATGSGYASSTFQYAYVDRAGVMDDSPANYTINWATPLPVILRSFTAVYTASGLVTLHWETVQESHIAYYELQKSGDAQVYASIGTRNARNQEGGQQYNFTDEQASARSYYRLRIVDQDGGIQYSPVLLVQQAISNTVELSPNPFYGELQIRLSASEATNATVSLSDMSGRMLYQQQLSLEKGMNQHTLRDVAGWPAGVYMVQVSCDGQQYQQKMVKQ